MPLKPRAKPKLYPDSDDYDSPTAYAEGCYRYLIDFQPTVRIKADDLMACPTRPYFYGVLGLRVPEAYAPFSRQTVQLAVRQSRKALYHLANVASRFSPKESNTLFAHRDERYYELTKIFEYYLSRADVLRLAQVGGDAILSQDFVNAWKDGVPTYEGDLE